MTVQVQVEAGRGKGEGGRTTPGEPALTLSTAKGKGPGAVHPSSPIPRPGFARAILRVPLVWKLAGANLLVALAAGVTVLLVHRHGGGAREIVVLVGLALAMSVVVSLLLVQIALLPLRELEATARRVRDGDYSARVPRSPLADRDMARVGGTLNLLLDRLTEDRARARALASEVISAGERERARIARDLHDSAAQSLAALMLQLSAAARDARDRDPAMAERLAALKEAASGVLEEIRTLSHTVHPRVLDDLGLVAALRNLARGAEGVSQDVEVAVAAEPPAAAAAAALDHASASVLYRVAQEAVGNALRHATPRAVTLTLSAHDRSVTLEVADDGRGFDLAEAERRRPGMGLFTMRERLSLVDGHFEVRSRPGGGGTTVRATVAAESRQ